MPACFGGLFLMGQDHLRGGPDCGHQFLGQHAAAVRKTLGLINQFVKDLEVPH